MAGMSVESVSADTAKYRAIPIRNAFGLRTPEPPKAPEPPKPSITVKLVGITSILSSKRVLLLVQEAGKPAETKILKEGETSDAVEVKTIDEVAGTVQIVNSGQEMTLNFEQNGVKPPTAPVAQPPQPGVPGMPPGMQPGMPGVVFPGQPGMPVPGNQPPVAVPGIPRPIRTQ
jgi:hypothetical protein